MGSSGSQASSEVIVVIVGAGGNIGSHLVPHLARMRQVDRVTLIDRDVYEARNVYAQDITPRDVGKPKAVVQARRLRRIRPSLHVEAISDAVERIPMGTLRSDVILSCLDSRISRQQVSQFAWRLGIPLIDAGVEAGGLLARVNVYVPGRDTPCLECAWDDRDYDALEQTYPCLGHAEVAATNAPSSLGSLAASLQAIECLKLLDGRADQAVVGKQVLLGRDSSQPIRHLISPESQLSILWSRSLEHTDPRPVGKRPHSVGRPRVCANGRWHFGCSQGRGEAFRNEIELCGMRRYAILAATRMLFAKEPNNVCLWATYDCDWVRLPRRVEREGRASARFGPVASQPGASSWRDV